jgi:uncharacterized protein YifN (PemK superfamily)
MTITNEQKKAIRVVFSEITCLPDTMGFYDPSFKDSKGHLIQVVSSQRLKDNINANYHRMADILGFRVMRDGKLK